MSYYAICKHDKLKGVADLNRVEGHNKRDPKYTKPDQHDSERQDLNETYHPNDGLTLFQRWTKSKEDRDIFVRKNAVWAVEYVLTSTSGAAAVLEYSESDWLEANREWIEGRHGKENVIAGWIHRDEVETHTHFVVIPIDKKGHLNARAFFGGTELLNKMQESYYQAMKRFGLQKGEGKTVDHEHAPKEWHQAIKDKVSSMAPVIMDRLEEFRKAARGWSSSARLRAAEELEKGYQFLVGRVATLELHLSKSSDSARAEKAKRRRAEKRLREEEERSRKVMEAALREQRELMDKELEEKDNEIVKLKSNLAGAGEFWRDIYEDRYNEKSKEEEAKSLEVERRLKERDKELESLNMELGRYKKAQAHQERALKEIYSKVAGVSPHKIRDYAKRQIAKVREYLGLDRDRGNDSEAPPMGRG